jgi:hypothetical protein
MWLLINLSVPAVLGIICFSLASWPRNGYHRVPMYVIGKIYANSMLVLINSRMVLGSEETPSTIMSVLKFATAPANNEDGDLVIDSTEGKTEPSRSSEP